MRACRRPGLPWKLNIPALKGRNMNNPSLAICFTPSGLRAFYVRLPRAALHGERRSALPWADMLGPFGQRCEGFCVPLLACKQCPSAAQTWIGDSTTTAALLASKQWHTYRNCSRRRETSGLHQNRPNSHESGYKNASQRCLKGQNKWPYYQPIQHLFRPFRAKVLSLTPTQGGALVVIHKS